MIKKSNIMLFILLFYSSFAFSFAGNPPTSESKPISDQPTKEYYSFEDLKKGLEQEKFYFQSGPKPKNALIDLSKMSNGPGASGGNPRPLSSFEAFNYSSTESITTLTGAAAPSKPGNVVYALRHDYQCLVQFNSETDEIMRMIRLPEFNYYTSFAADEKGGCYIANDNPYGQNNILYYDSKLEKMIVITRLSSMEESPYIVQLTKDKLIVSVCPCSESGKKSKLIFIDKQTHKIFRSMSLAEDSPSISSLQISGVSYDGNRYLFVAAGYSEKMKNEVGKGPDYNELGVIYIIDVKTMKIVKKIEVDKQYNFLKVVSNIGDKIYVAASSKGFLTAHYMDFPDNNEILVYSLSSGKLLKKIIASPKVRFFVHDDSSNRILVGHFYSRTMEAIDLGSDSVNSNISLPTEDIYDMSYVNSGKLYVSGQILPANSSRYQEELFVIDSSNGKVIKQFDGYYREISSKVNI